MTQIAGMPEGEETTYGIDDMAMMADSGTTVDEIVWPRHYYWATKLEKKPLNLEEKPALKLEMGCGWDGLTPRLKLEKKSLNRNLTPRANNVDCRVTQHRHLRRLQGGHSRRRPPDLQLWYDGLTVVHRSVRTALECWSTTSVV